MMDEIPDETVDGLDDIPEHTTMGPVTVPPIPLEDIEDHAERGTRRFGRLIALYDISKAQYHTMDPTLDGHVPEDGKEIEDYSHEERYSITEESLAELKVAHHLISSAYNREMCALAEDLGIDPEESENLKHDIQDALGYERPDLEDMDFVDPDDVFEDLSLDENPSGDEIDDVLDGE